MNTPILYLVFNRPDLVKKSFKKIQELKPKRLFIAGDGPREGFEEDKKKCKEVKEIISNGICWDCEVNYLYREINLGCGIAVSEAISWFFENVEEGIILEDDCLPDISFFPFCEELLQRYRGNKKIYHISGSNWQRGCKRGKADYYFSHFPGVWGWATWKDRWKLYKFDIFEDEDDWRLVEKNLPLLTSSKMEAEFHKNCFKACEGNKIDTWDYQWRFTVFRNKGICIFPNKNLVSNLGHGEDATHTLNKNHWRSNLETEEIRFPIIHPKRIKISKKADKFLISNLTAGKENKKKPPVEFLKKVKLRISRILKSF